MGGCEIDEESHRNCVCASKRYRATDLATGTLEGTGQVCVWQGDMTRALDVSVCVWGGEGGGGRQMPNYRGRMTSICVEKERTSYTPSNPNPSR